MSLEPYISKEFQLVLADPPWPYYGDPNKMAAAGKHYDLMSMEELEAMPVKEICSKKAACFMWATGPRLHEAVDLMRAWGFHYRGVAWVWVKTRQDGEIMGPAGVPPTFVKPTTEFIIAGTTNKVGRPFPIQTSKMRQVVLAPRGKHSEKPAVFHKNIEELCGDVKKIELFAREPKEGWVTTGFELTGTKY